jgi:hypothetical protein
MRNYCNDRGDKIQMNLSNFKKNDLEGFSKDEIREILRQEWRSTIIHEKLKWEYDEIADNDLTIKILNSYFLDRAAIELSNNNPDDPYKAKLNGSLVTRYQDQSEDFLRTIMLLLLNGFLQRVKILEEEYDLLLNVEFSDDFYQGYLKQVVHERNLYWIFMNHRDLFKTSQLADEDDLIMMEHHSLIFQVDDSEESIFDKLNTYGTIIELLSSESSVLSLSHKGMYLLQIDQYHKNHTLFVEQRVIAETLEASKQDLFTKISETETQLSEVHSEMKQGMEAHNNKINSFYKDIAAILSILVAAFAVIGVNISAIPKIESNFSINVITLNVSLCLVLVIMFSILRKTVFISKEKDSMWGIVLIILILFCGTLYFAQIEYKETNVLNNQKKFEEQENQIEEKENQIKEQDLRINELISNIQKGNEKYTLLKEEFLDLRNEFTNLKNTQRGQ